MRVAALQIACAETALRQRRPVVGPAAVASRDRHGLRAHGQRAVCRRHEVVAHRRLDAGGHGRAVHRRDHVRLRADVRDRAARRHGDGEGVRVAAFQRARSEAARRQRRPVVGPAAVVRRDRHGLRVDREITRHHRHAVVRVLREARRQDSVIRADVRVAARPAVRHRAQVGVVYQTFHTACKRRVCCAVGLRRSRHRDCHGLRVDRHRRGAGVILVVCRRDLVIDRLGTLVDVRDHRACVRRAGIRAVSVFDGKPAFRIADGHDDAVRRGVVGRGHVGGAHGHRLRGDAPRRGRGILVVALARDGDRVGVHVGAGQIARYVVVARIEIIAADRHARYAHAPLRAVVYEPGFVQRDRRARNGHRRDRQRAVHRRDGVVRAHVFLAVHDLVARRDGVVPRCGLRHVRHAARRLGDQLVAGEQRAARQRDRRVRMRAAVVGPLLARRRDRDRRGGVRHGQRTVRVAYGVVRGRAGRERVARHHVRHRALAREGDGTGHRRADRVAAHEAGDVVICPALRRAVVGEGLVLRRDGHSLRVDRQGAGDRRDDIVRGHVRPAVHDLIARRDGVVPRCGLRHVRHAARRLGDQLVAGEQRAARQRDRRVRMRAAVVGPLLARRRDRDRRGGVRHGQRTVRVAYGVVRGRAGRERVARHHVRHRALAREGDGTGHRRADRVAAHEAGDVIVAVAVGCSVVCEFFARRRDRHSLRADRQGAVLCRDRIVRGHVRRVMHDRVARRDGVVPRRGIGHDRYAARRLGDQRVAGQKSAVCDRDFRVFMRAAVVGPRLARRRDRDRPLRHGQHTIGIGNVIAVGHVVASVFDDRRARDVIRAADRRLAAGHGHGREAVARGQRPVGIGVQYQRRAVIGLRRAPRRDRQLFL